MPMGNARSIQERIVIPLQKRKKKKKDCHVEGFFFFFSYKKYCKSNQIFYYEVTKATRLMTEIILLNLSYFKFILSLCMFLSPKKKKLVYVSIKKSTT